MKKNKNNILNCIKKQKQKNKKKQKNKNRNIFYCILLVLLVFSYIYYLITENIKKKEKLNNELIEINRQNFLLYKKVDFDVIENEKVIDTYQVLVDRNTYDIVEQYINFIYSLELYTYVQEIDIYICDKIMNIISDYLIRTKNNYYVYYSYVLIEKKCFEILTYTNNITVLVETQI
jgi:hypothetical protein